MLDGQTLAQHARLVFLDRKSSPARYDDKMAVVVGRDLHIGSEVNLDRFFCKHLVRGAFGDHSSSRKENQAIAKLGGEGQIVHR